MMRALVRDVRFAARTLVKRPGFALAAIGTLALGIGATTAMFSVVSTTFLRALPYPAPGALLWITERSSVTGRDGSVAYPNFLDWRAQQEAFSAFSVYQADSATLRAGETVEKIPVLMVSDGFFSALGVGVAHGRAMAADDDRPDAAPVAWVAHAAWRAYFGADPELVGRTINLDGQSVAVAGLLPATFRLFHPADLVVPLAPRAQALGLTSRSRRASTFVIGRLRPGATLESARTQMETITRRLEAQYPDSNAGIVANVMPLREHVAGSARRQLMLLLGAVGVVLLIGCVNLATVLLARAADRQHEMAIRAALGASRRRLVRQLLAESLLLAGCGGVLGGLLGMWAYGLVSRLVPSGMRQLAASGAPLDIPALLFIVGVSVATGIAFGLAPAWRLSRSSASGALKGAERVTPASSGRVRVGDFLVVSQVALAFTLLVCSGLMLRSLRQILEVDPGFRPDPVLTLRLPSPPMEQYRYDPLSFVTYYEQILQAVRGRPEVDGAAVVSNLPFGGTNSSVPILPDLAERVMPPGGPGAGMGAP
jgi:putative ABC transport system permease protein